MNSFSKSLDSFKVAQMEVNSALYLTRCSTEDVLVKEIIKFGSEMN